MQRIIRQTINAGEGMEKRGPSHTAGGNIKWCSHYGKPDGVSLKKLKIVLPHDLLLGIYLKKTLNLKRYMHPSVHCSTNYNSQDMEAT